MSNQDLQRAFGTGMAGYGFTLAIFGGLSLASMWPFAYSMRRHNKFILLVCCIVDVLVPCFLMGVAGGLRELASPQFDKALQNDCLRNQPISHTPEQCAPYLKSDRVAGFRLYWEGYFAQRADALKIETLSVLIEQAVPCCGFFAPQGCVANSDPYPSGYLLEGVEAAELKQRVSCGPGASLGYYPVQDNCLQYSNILVNPPIVGGCLYDLGIGFCLDKPVYPYTMGCASFVEDYCSSLILPHALCIFGMIAFNLLAAYLALVMVLKRKESDVLPELYPKPQVRIRQADTTRATSSGVISTSLRISSFVSRVCLHNSRRVNGLTTTKCRTSSLSCPSRITSRTSGSRTRTPRTTSTWRPAERRLPSQ
jgi:hypothetical protein